MVKTTFALSSAIAVRHLNCIVHLRQFLLKSGVAGPRHALQMAVKATDRKTVGCALPFSRKMNAGEILWRGFMKSAIQTKLWRKREKVLLLTKRLWPLEEKRQEN
jgi:hypothetical protein